MDNAFVIAKYLQMVASDTQTDMGSSLSSSRNKRPFLRGVYVCVYVHAHRKRGKLLNEKIFSVLSTSEKSF